MIRQKLRELGCEVLMHLSYSPDLAPSDYHLFRSLQNSLNNVKLTSKEACENLLQFFVQKSQKFYSDGIMVLPQNGRKWSKTAHIWFNKFHLKYEKNLFLYCIIIRRNFVPNQIF